ncbi:MAG: DUF2382 domain-containing protein [Stigonema ocellatum SAG 48.90 = DSM 106950]|nr:DUF2382 domain-containing protein [Stigonema ocellatum SAG 48.90 = DSM 106950]
MISLNAYNLKQNDRISTLLESLRKKVNKFAVVDRKGHILGEVKDLIIDVDRQISFVISRGENLEKNPHFRLRTNLVQKIDSPNKRILTNIDSLPIEDIPEYIEMEKKIINPEVNTDSITSNAEETDNNSDIPSVVTQNLEPVEEEIIRLLGERLVVDRSKRKIGEVIVRKEIETRMIQVPVRHEKLIVEQVSPERKQLAEIDLGHGEISDIELIQGQKVDFASTDSGFSVSGEFSSPKIASLLLNAIALERNHGCKKVRVTILLEDEERQKTYQEWFSRTSTSKNYEL